MGQPSYLLVGLGNDAFLSSASHGAGRALTRRAMRMKDARGERLGLEGVECISLKRERVVEEAPLAYNAVGPVVDVQTDVGIAKPVARMRPLVTFKA
jgi:tRNA-splicing ligase RtcB